MPIDDSKSSLGKYMLYAGQGLLLVLTCLFVAFMTATVLGVRATLLQQRHRTISNATRNHLQLISFSLLFTI